MIGFKHRGSFNKIEKFFIRMSGARYLDVLDKYGQAGVDALAAATPINSGETAKSWDFIIEREKTKTTITWVNTNAKDGVTIALILQYGHGTGTGGYVQGIDYINPAIKPIFEKIAEEAWGEVIIS